MRNRINLNFDWCFCQEYKEEHIKDYNNLEGFSNVNIPHTIIETPFNNFDEKKMQIISCYKKVINVKKEYEGKDLTLVFEGVAHMSTIYVNDDFVVIHKGGYDSFKVDITDYVKYGDNNIITIIVDATENPHIPPFGGFIDYLGYGGIYREVYLDVCTKGKIIDFKVRAKDALNSITAYCDITVDIHPANLEVTVYDGEEEVSFNRYIINRDKDIFDFDVKYRRLWSIEEPNLYTIKIKLLDDKTPLDEVTGRFGFRTIEFNNSGFYLNGTKVNIRGLNRHQSYPYVGYAMPKSAQVKDAEILKYELGVNMVRTSHYMQSKHFLDRCDEIGLLVLEEIPGWQYIGDDEFKNNSKNNVEAMIERDYNHPSIVLWGVRINESFDDKHFYTQTNKIAHELDSTRPTCGIRYLAKSEFLEDVFTFNDFTPIGRHIIAKPKRSPYLISEHNGHMFPTKTYDNEARRIEHAIRHLKVINEANGASNIAGAIGWCMCDYNTHKDFGSGDKVCYHGVLDMFRNSKYAADAYSSQRDSDVFLSVASLMAKGDYDASIYPGFYVFTNCEYVKLFKNNDYVATFYPDKKNFEYLPHPPVFINDTIGCLLEKHEKFSKKDSDKLKKIFKIADKSGFNIGFFNYIKVFFLLLKYRMKKKNFVDLYYKYTTGKPNEDVIYRIDGYTNENVAKSTTVSNICCTNIEIKVDNSNLVVQDTYDVTRVAIKCVDEYGNITPYTNIGVAIEVTGGVDLIGPNLISLQGGVAGFWVKTNQKANKGLIRVIANGQELTTEVNIKEKING